MRTLSLLTLLAVALVSLSASAVALAGTPPHRIVDPDSVMHPSGRSLTGVSPGTPAPSLTARTTSVSGHVYFQNPVAPLGYTEVTYWVPGSSGWLSWTTTTDQLGAFTFPAAPAATGNGELYAKIPYSDGSVARTGLTWPDGGSAVFDLYATNAPVSITRGGPWSDWSQADTFLLGNDGVSDVASVGVVTNPSPETTGTTTVPAIPGNYTGGAINFWDNEGVEVSRHFRSPLSADYDFTDAEFVDAGHGWIIDQEGFVVRTTDGGTTWQHTDTREAGGWSRHLAALDFADAQHGLLLDGATTDPNAILKTTDGGLSYAVTDVSPEVYIDIAMPDATHAWVVGEGGVIAKSTDCGSTWSGQTSGTSSSLVSVYFSDATHGWASGSDGTIIRTTNGGTVWETQTSNVTGWIRCISVPDGQHGWALNNDGTVLTSTDAGATWFPAAWQTDEMKWPIRAINWITLRDADEGWMLASDGSFHTTDGGQTWTTASVPSGIFSVAPAVVAPIDTAHAWVAGPYGLLTDTTDGGASWTDTGPSFDETNAQRLIMKTPVFASGKPGSKVTLSFANFPAGWTSSLLGYPAWPATAPVKSLGTHTGADPADERVTVTIPRTATPGYFYVIEAEHDQGPLSLGYPFQVCTLKPSATSIRRGASVRLSGTVPTQGHEGTKAGKRKYVYVFRRTTAAGQPTVGDPTKKGWKFVRAYRTDGFGKYRTGLLPQTRSTWYVVMYQGDDWYWGGYTSVVKVGVR